MSFNWEQFSVGVILGVFLYFIGILILNKLTEWRRKR
jgi:hypothetical protein